MAMATITLDRNDLGLNPQDGLTQRMESYAHTAEFLDDETDNSENLIIDEVRDSSEARTLARNYQRILEEITRQLEMPA